MSADYKRYDLSRHPILQGIYDTQQLIEKCGASDALTDAVCKAGSLREIAVPLLDELAECRAKLKQRQRVIDAFAVADSVLANVQLPDVDSAARISAVQRYSEASAALRAVARTGEPRRVGPIQFDEVLCSDCPPVDYPTDETRCATCPRSLAVARGAGPEPFMYEDDLPEYMTKEEYRDWYAKSWVDGVRMGPVFTRNKVVGKP